MNFNLENKAAQAIGVDIIDVDRIEKLHKKTGEAFLKRVFTESEAQYCLSQKNPYPHLAARFAAKEAISKAFGTGIGAVKWTSISIEKDSNNAPVVVLDDSAKECLQHIGGSKVLISLSHTQTQAIAFSVVI